MDIESTYEGLPYRGPRLDIKESDPEQFKPALRHEVHVRLFKLSNEEDIVEYNKMWQAIADGKAVLSMEDIKHTGGANWLALVRWADLYYGAPEATPFDKLAPADGI